MKFKLIHFLVIFFTCFLFLISIMLVSKNYLILGGEGNYFTNFGLIKDIGSYTWVSINGGIGAPNPTLNGLIVIFDFFLLLQKSGASLKLVNSMLAFLAYVLPFLSMMWMLNKALKVNFFTSYILSLFYVLNPFSTYHLQDLMFWNIAPLFVFPIIFGCIYKYYLEKFKLFLYFGLLTAILAFSFSNIPYLGIFQIFLFISIVIIPYIRSIKFDLKRILINVFITELSFILFNAWWFINLLRFQMQDLKNYYTSEFAVSWAISSAGSGSILGRILSLKTLVMSARNTFFSDLYGSFPISVLLFIPFFLIIWNLYKKSAEQKLKGDNGPMLVFGIILMVLFLNKGVNEPFTGIYLWLLGNVPFFIIFKSPLEKFGILLVFLLTIALVQVFRNTKAKWTYYALIAYLVVCSIPYVTLNIFPEYKFEEDGKYVSKHYIDKKGYFQARESLNKNKLDYRVLSLPGSNNYQVTVLNHDGNRYYRGMDPFVYSVNKPFIAAYTAPESNLDHIFKNFSNDAIEDKLLDIYNVRRIVIDRDNYPAFGFREKESIKKLTEIFSKSNEKHRFNPIIIFGRDSFLPHFYVPDTNTVSNQEPEDIVKWATTSAGIRHTVYFQTQNKDKNLKRLQEKGETSTQILEFKKIDPTKYRVIIHRAKGIVPIIFSENFHPRWKLYLSPVYTRPTQRLELKDYKVLDGNHEDQATTEELRDFLTKGLISSVGDGKEKFVLHKKWLNGEEKPDYKERYTIDFISKNYQGTIQNDNLPSGENYETWFKNALADEGDHIVANGYANGWILDADKICNGRFQAACVKNSDGTYDFEIVVEFWPQRLLYAGLAISAGTLIISIFYIIGMRMMLRRKSHGYLS